jgi:hypothetical protein
MKIKKEILIIISISFLLSIFGFILDLNERVQNIWINIYEIGMMTVIIFCALATIFYSLKFMIILLRRQF